MALRALEAKPPPPDVLSDKSRLRGWWYRVGRRLAIDAARATKRSVAALDTDEPSNPEVRNSLVVDGDPSGQLERAQFLALVLSTARRLLKEPERVALHLRYSEARSDAEIAQLVGGTAKGINSRINRALKKLRQRFAEADIQPA
jgi:RNA polymerase sigma factor (sigma-70 family)